MLFLNMEAARQASSSIREAGMIRVVPGQHLTDCLTNSKVLVNGSFCFFKNNKSCILRLSETLSIKLPWLYIYCHILSGLFLLPFLNCKNSIINSSAGVVLVNLIWNVQILMSVPISCIFKKHSVMCVHLYPEARRTLVTCKLHFFGYQILWIYSACKVGIW